MAFIKQTVHIWEGERKLLPLDYQQRNYQLRCVNGCGYLRLMSESHPIKISGNVNTQLCSGEIATVSAITDMEIELSSASDNNL